MDVKQKEFKVYHIELSTLCNASCALCARSWGGELTVPHLKSLSLLEIKNLFPPDLIKSLDRVYFCGNFGDPAAAPECLNIVEYFRQNNLKLNLGLHTNGGLRDRAFWKALAPLLTYCRFGIDGLEDTNHIYRRNVNWEKLMENCREFIQNGGKAEWDFITFKHNEHQVDEVVLFAQRLGFKKLNVKHSSRFENQSIQVKQKIKNEYINYKLERPTHSKPLTSAAVLKQSDSIECQSLKNKSLYISALGKIYPCCWLGEKYETINSLSVESKQFKGFYNEYSLDEWFKPDKGFDYSAYVHNWSLENNSPKKLNTCVRKCTAHNSQFLNQFQKSYEF